MNCTSAIVMVCQRAPARANPGGERYKLECSFCAHTIEILTSSVVDGVGVCLCGTRLTIDWAAAHRELAAEATKRNVGRRDICSSGCGARSQKIGWHDSLSHTPGTGG